MKLARINHMKLDLFKLVDFRSTMLLELTSHLVVELFTSKIVFVCFNIWSVLLNSCLLFNYVAPMWFQAYVESTLVVQSVFVANTCGPYVFHSFTHWNSQKQCLPIVLLCFCLGMPRETTGDHAVGHSSVWNLPISSSPDPDMASIGCLDTTGTPYS